MISSRVWLLALGMISSFTGCVGADHPDDGDASAIDKPEIVSVEDALTHSADSTSPVQLEATLALGDFWAKDATTGPELVELLLQHLEPGGNQLVQSAAEISIQKIGRHVLPSIKDALTSDNHRRKAGACQAIKSIGPDAIELLPELIEMLESGETFQQRFSLFALQGFADQAFDAIEPVAGCLKSDDFNVHCMACRFLENYGSDALPAEEDLVQILAEGVPSSRGWAAIVLGAIGPTDKKRYRAHVDRQAARVSGSSRETTNPDWIGVS